MIRGINRQDIFETPEDYRTFIETLASLREVVSEDMQTKICTCHIYAYCIMPNHVIPDIEIRDAVINACGLRSISDFQLLTLERRKSVIQEVMRSLDVRPRQLSRVTGMNYETIRNIAKNCHENRHPYPGACPHDYMTIMTIVYYPNKSLFIWCFGSFALSL